MSTNENIDDKKSEKIEDENINHEPTNQIEAPNILIDEEKNEALSEEENEFVVDLGNTTPVKTSGNFKFDIEKAESSLDENTVINTEVIENQIKNHFLPSKSNLINEKKDNEISLENNENTNACEDKETTDKEKDKDEKAKNQENNINESRNSAFIKPEISISTENLGNKQFNVLENEKNQHQKDSSKNKILENELSITSSSPYNRVLMTDIEPKIKFEKLLNSNLEAKYQFRICIVGDSNVGKTSLLTRYCDDIFKSSMTNTIGVDFRVLMLKYNDTFIKLQIWDTAGQERFKSISVNYFKSAHGFIFVYDITNRLTFDNLNNWFDIVNQHNKNSICNFVVGNKCDLEERRQVNIEEGKEFAFSNKFNFMETSAKSSKNVDMAFEIFTLKLMEYYHTKDKQVNEGEIQVDNFSDYSGDGRKFKIEDIYDEKTMSKRKKNGKGKCKC